MSFGRFIYYCAMWGAAAAFFGWGLGRLLETETTRLGASLTGMWLGLFIALGLGVLDALAAGSQRDVANLGIRLILAMLIGAVGGLGGGFLGQMMYEATHGSNWG